MADEHERKELEPQDRLQTIRSLAIEAGPSPAAHKIVEHVDVLLGVKKAADVDNPQEPRGTFNP